MKRLTKYLQQIINFFKLEQDDFNILDSTELLRRRNILVNRVLMLTNVFVTIIAVTYPLKVPAYQTVSVLIPTVGINFLIYYFVNYNAQDHDKQLLGMYVAVLSVCYLSFRMYFLYPSAYSYFFIYYALIVVALFQNRHAMIIGGTLSLVIATIFHMSDVNKLAANDEPVYTIISSRDHAMRDVTILSFLLLFYVFVLTAMVIFSEYLDRERKKELQRRSELEREFNEVLFNVFDTIEDFAQINDQNELSGDYAVAIMSKKLALMLGMNEQEADRVFAYAISTGINYDYSLDYDEMQKQNLLKDYDSIKYKLDMGSRLLRRMRLKIKMDALVRSRFESNWFHSSQFKQMTGEDSSLENQIVLICDTYVTLRDRQSYKKPMVHAKAIKELADHFTHIFDERVLNTFLENHVEFEVVYEKIRHA
ncbi:MAG TPA: hypothetical protein VIK63_05260 [Haloplasmataceae bacterium]